MAGDEQGAFAEALIDRDRPVPAGLTSWTGERPPRRFGVYRNNVSGALIEALGVRYPVIKRLVGDEFFRAMTREYVLSHLPQSPVLIHYGGEYPDFIAEFPPAANVSYLADVARLESAYWQAYHAADAMPLAKERLAAVAPERLAALTFTFHPAVFIVASAYPIVSIWETNSHDAEVRPVDLSVSEDALVTRPALSVEVRRLPEGGATFLRALKAGARLGDAAATAIAASPGFDLARNLAGLIEAQVIAGLVDGDAE